MGIRKHIKEINLSVLEKEVLNNQMNMVAAYRNKDMKRMKSIARKILLSNSATKLSIDRVMNNTSFRSPGFSKNLLSNRKDIESMISYVQSIIRKPKLYKSDPLSRIYLEKPSGGKRPISIPSYKDRVIQQIYKFVVEPMVEEHSDNNSYGLRKFRSPQWAIAQLSCNWNRGSRTTKPIYAVKIDIKKCYDQISHEWITKNIPIVPKNIIKEWLKCGYIEWHSNNKDIWPTEEEVSQEGLISPVICNMTLNGFEKYLENSMYDKYKYDPKKRNRNDIRGAFRYFRFADDILILTFTEESAKFVLKEFKTYLIPRGLEINEDKTKIIKLDEKPAKFLGYHIKAIRKRGAIRIYRYPSPENQIRIRAKLKKCIKDAKSLESLFNKTNNILRGYLNYYQFCNSSIQFKKLQHWLWNKFYQKLSKTYRNNRGMRNRNRILKKKVYLQYKKQYSRRTLTQGQGKGTLWFQLKKDERSKSGKTLPIDLDLVAPYETKVKSKIKPILVGIPETRYKNPFHHEDRKNIQQIALKFKGDTFRDKILKKTEGHCALCERSIIADKIPWELHHAKPIRIKFQPQIKSCFPLCKPCHYHVTNVINKDIDKKLNNQEKEMVKQLVQLGLYET